MVFFTFFTRCSTQNNRMSVCFVLLFVFVCHNMTAVMLFYPLCVVPFGPTAIFISLCFFVYFDVYAHVFEVRFRLTL